MGNRVSWHTPPRRISSDAHTHTPHPPHAHTTQHSTAQHSTTQHNTAPHPTSCTSTPTPTHHHHHTPTHNTNTNTNTTATLTARNITGGDATPNTSCARTAGGPATPVRDVLGPDFDPARAARVDGQRVHVTGGVAAAQGGSPVRLAPAQHLLAKGRRVFLLQVASWPGRVPGRLTRAALDDVELFPRQPRHRLARLDGRHHLLHRRLALAHHLVPAIHVARVTGAGAAP